ncbi:MULTISPECIES: ferric reductase-like transmembrane domain-containing protein [Streptomyces]|uniref:Ferric reductase-like transmembrane domain-containing protein n=1 Tax=Streptomyces koelreuteriae TaxID=2838015 RepID=A0ABX8FLZ6_9ACTN|nr:MULTISPECIES: ferric reductase-like transmembrane domain-containing protein [Streptomyces]QWB22168.1 ferric reductase-like transmembrane domain-containing protein [Streptomyces koelreuteriae]UUA05109.1 ferric reductase-like transmembrane domain-containing protein [Streptomyces koelreuteriae]UUA12733.1 ferric reductase-like transmembrane domain-containing protein [Streptomyces sp. CRCS-T-1]
MLVNPRSDENGTSVPRPGSERVALRGDLRSALPDAAAAVVVTAAVFALLWARMESGTSDTVAVMPFMDDPGTYWMYLLSQAFGWSGLLWAWGTVMLGLLLSGPGPGRLPVSRQALERWHRTTSLTTMALMFAHALMFAAELVRYEAQLGWAERLWAGFADTFVPGWYDSGTGRIAIPLGQGALYLAIPLGLLFYVRHRIGANTWRRLHRFVIVVYVLSVWHTLLYGTNVWYGEWPRTVLWLLQLPVAALLVLRLLRPARRGERLTAPGARAGVTWPTWTARAAGRIAAGAVVVGLLLVVASGRDGGRERPAEPPATQPHAHETD